jgi:hypothetical protein
MATIHIPADEELGYKPVMDEAFANDLEEIIRNRKAVDRSAATPWPLRIF